MKFLVIFATFTAFLSAASLQSRPFQRISEEQNVISESLLDHTPVKEVFKSSKHLRKKEPPRWSFMGWPETPIFCNTFMVPRKDMGPWSIVARIALRKLVKIYSTVFMALYCVKNGIYISNTLPLHCFFSFLLGVLFLLFRNQQEMDLADSNLLAFCLDILVKMEGFIFVVGVNQFLDSLQNHFQFFATFFADIIIGYYINALIARLHK